MERLEIENINDVPKIKALMINYMTYEYEGDAELDDDSVLRELNHLYDNGLMHLLLEYELTFSDHRVRRMFG